MREVNTFDVLIESVDRPHGRRIPFVDRAEDGREQKLGLALRHQSALPENLGPAPAPLVPLSNPNPHAAVLPLADAAPLKSFSTHLVVSFLRRKS
jgi:hypothetical protein